MLPGLFCLRIFKMSFLVALCDIVRAVTMQPFVAELNIVQLFTFNYNVVPYKRVPGKETDCLTKRVKSLRKKVSEKEGNQDQSD